MALPTIFNNLTTNPSSLSLFDANFNAVAAMGTTQCTATGTNTIALAQNANQPTLAAYVNYLAFSFVALNTSTGSVTANVNSIGALPVYLQDSVTQAGSGNIVTGVYYEIIYNSALNSGSGGFQIISGNTAASPTLTSLTNSLTNDVLLNNTSTYFEGPSVAQGTVGIWYASGTITVQGSVGSTFNVKLWDGTNVIASTSFFSVNSQQPVPVSLSGIIANPVGDIRISVNDLTDTSGVMVHNSSTGGKDSTVSAFRIG